MVKNTTENHYGEENIQVLEGLEPVRKRPGMYIGSTDEKGLHHLAVEILDNSIDEALAGYCTHAYITINADGSLTIEDNGRGIPCGIHKTEGVSAVEVCLTKLHAGGKFGGGGYTISGGLHGVGLSCVNALSEWLVVEVDQDGKHHYQKYMRGVPQAPLAVKGEAESTGTKITFMPDKEIFDTVLWDYDRLKLRAREVAYLNKGITIVLADNREGRAKSETFCFLGGVAEFVDNLNRTKEKIFTETVYIDKSVKEGEVEIALQFNDGYNEIIYSYANNICTEEGGAHLDGFKNALTKVVNDYAHKLGLLKDEEKLAGEDVREGLTAVVSVKLTEPQFEGQTKTKLGNASMRTAVARVVNDELGTYFEENPKEARELIIKCISAQRAREAARSARELTRRKGVFETTTLPGQACRLHREKRRLQRNLYRRGRQRRRHGENGQRPPFSGDSAAKGKNSQRGKGASRTRFGKRGNKIHDYGFRLRHRRRIQRKQIEIQAHNMYDRRGRGRQPHQNFAFDLLLPLYAPFDRKRTRVHRAAASVQNHQKQAGPLCLQRQGA